MSNNSLNQLNIVLDVKIKLYEDLKNLLVEEKSVMEKVNISVYQKFLLKKELILKKLRDLEDKRKALLAKIAQEMEISFNDISLSKIIKKTDGPMGAKLIQSRKQLIKLINSIDKLQTHNERLVCRISDSNNKVLGFFNRFNKNSSYAADGKMGRSTSKSWMLNAQV